METVRRLGQTVFVPEAPTRWRVRNLVVALSAASALAVLASLRASSTPITTTVWAEDGRVFLGDAIGRGALRSLFLGYAGYGHLVPRLIAAAVSALPPHAAAFGLAATAAGIVGLLAVFCANASRAHITTRAGRAVYAAIIVALPVAGIEVLGNIANLHWFLSLAAFWAVVRRPADTRNIVLSCVVVALAALSDPLAAFVFPLIVWRLATVTAWRDRAVPVVMLSALATQFLVSLRAEDQGVGASFRGTLGLFERRVGAGSLLGVHALMRFFDRFGDGGIHVLVAIATVIGLTLLWRYGNGERVFVVICLAAAGGLFLTSTGLRGGGTHPELVGGLVATGSRYSVVPALLVAAAAIVLLERTDWRVTGVALAGVLAVCIVDFRVPTLRDDRMTWARGIAIARTQCRFGVDPARIPILPDSEARDWFVPVPCSYLSEGSHD